MKLVTFKVPAEGLAELVIKSQLNPISIQDVDGDDEPEAETKIGRERICDLLAEFGPLDHERLCAYYVARGYGSKRSVASRMTDSKLGLMVEGRVYKTDEGLWWLTASELHRRATQASVKS